MSRLPQKIYDYLNQLIIEDKTIYYVRIDADGAVADIAGDASFFGYADLRVGASVNGEIDFLEGMLEDVHESFSIECLSLIADRYCDIHLIPLDEGIDVLFLDVTEETQRKLALQQSRNEAKLLHAELEERVKERTGQLSQAYEELKQEIDERQMAEEQMHTLQGQLEHISRLSTMGEIAAELAHELNQPLGAISNYVQGCLHFIESGAPDLAVLKEAMEKISIQSRRAGQIIHRLRDYVAKRAPKKSFSDTNNLVHEVSDLLDVDIRHKQIQLHLDLARGMPAVFVDRIQIQQVLFNVMRNAIDALEESALQDRQLFVSTSMPAENTVEVSVKDKGPGCSAEVLDNMFNPFFTTKDAGMGMGLSICRTILEAHGGGLQATPNPDAGLNFTFTLPVIREDQNDEG